MKLDDPKSYLVNYTEEEKANEVWKPISGYEGYYEVSNLGRVKSLTRTVSYTRYQYQTGEYTEIQQRVKESIINPGIHKDFYWNMPLTKDGITKIHLLHVLVARAFIPNPLELPCVNHVDGDKKNIRISNLEWVTHSYNSVHAIQTGLRKKNIIAVICTEIGLIYPSMRVADRTLSLPEGRCWNSIHEHRAVSGYSFKKV